VALVNHAGDRALILEPEPLTLVTVNLDDASVRFNGAEVQAEPLGQDAKIRRFVPRWLPGRNTLAVRGTAADGTAVSKEFSFVHVAGGSLAAGETAILTFGVPSSKSGPFFRVVVEGPALHAAPPSQAAVYVVSADGWLSRESRVTQELRAVTPGTAVVRVFEKPHFRQPEELRKAITITVTATP
jgi:hypothetical protein